jgi:glyoxylase-like metal-dependent hydrolase (beta-lactamase superfamily II)
MIKTKQIINDIHKSNCYIVQNQINGKCLVIDPGGRNVDNILQYITQEHLEIEYIILTHSHYDHITGVDSLARDSKAIIISSGLCSEKIQDPVKNLSYFSDFGILKAPKSDIFIEDLPNHSLLWNNNLISFYLSPGHTLCSICIGIGNLLFTGDTILKGIKSIVTPPDGNKQDLKKTLINIYDTVPGETLIMPGHGDSFILKTQDLSVSLKK